jgi:hypothetical protein
VVVAVVVVGGGAVVVVGATVVVVGATLVLVGACSVVGVLGSAAGSPGVVGAAGTSPGPLVDVGGAARSSSDVSARAAAGVAVTAAALKTTAMRPSLLGVIAGRAPPHTTAPGVEPGEGHELGRLRRAAVGDAREPASRCWSTASWARSSPCQPVEASGGSLARPWNAGWVAFRSAPSLARRMVVGIVWFDVDRYLGRIGYEGRASPHRPR